MTPRCVSFQWWWSLYGGGESGCGVCVEVGNRRVMAASSGGVVVFSSFLRQKFPVVGEFACRWSIAM